MAIESGGGTPKCSGESAGSPQSQTLGSPSIGPETKP
jgi:hypothetical protein